MRAWHIVVLVLAAGLGLGGYHACNVYRVSDREARAYHALDNLTQVRGTRPLTADLVRKRVVEWLGRIGIQVRPDDVGVRIEPVTRANEKQLSIQARKAIDIARKMPNHEIRASVLTLDLSARVQSGWVTRRFSIHRVYLVKGPAKATADEADDDGDEAHEGDADDGNEE